MRLYLIAMLDEAKDIIESFSKIEDTQIELYEKEDVMVAITAIGKVNAAMSLAYILARYNNIDKIINIGFAGAYGNYEVGDNVLVKEAIYHDFDLTAFNYEHGRVPNIKEKLITKEKYLKLFYDFKQTKLYTGDSFQTETISDNYLADMEGGALYHVSYLFNKEIFSMKVVSDVIGNNNTKSYEEFEKIGSKNILNLYNIIEERLKVFSKI